VGVAHVDDCDYSSFVMELNVQVFHSSHNDTGNESSGLLLRDPRRHVLQEDAQATDTISGRLVGYSCTLYTSLVF
jgi:hypothetical protein